MEATVRALFVNENLGGHAALHLHLRRALDDQPRVRATFLDVPPKAGWRRVASARLPPLDRLDLDFQQLRFQLAQSVQVRRDVARLAGPFDVVHFYTQNTALASVGLLRRTPSVVSTDSTNELHAYQLPYRQPTRFTPLVVRAGHRTERRVFDAATLVVAQSEWVARSLRDRYGVDDDRLRTVPVGITVPESRARSTPSSDGLVTFVGSSMDRKGGWRLLDVWRRRLRDRARLALVTHDAVPAEPGVLLLGDLQPGDPRLWDLLAETDVFAFPSEVDKSSLAVLEAMSAGVPVVTTDVAALPELVGDAGVVVPAGDDHALARAVGDLLDDTERRTQLGEAARRRVLERFDARQTTAALLAVLDEARERRA